jgi:outer membrane protein insertion porin family
VDALKAAFPLKQGDLFSTEKVRKALETYGKIYGEYGFIDFTPEPDTEVDDVNKIINLTMRFDEQKQYYVRRIDFSGNTTTRDKVIRRQLLIDEGQLFNKRLWELSILRLNQLDYFDKIEADKAAEIKRNNKEGTVDINLKLKEKGKQSIGLQGGVSGLAGSFIGLTYQTNNFLGLGETLTFSAQFGDLSRSFMFGFTEPYLFDRPISSGFTIFSSRYNFDQAKQEAILTGQQVSINPQFVQNYVQNSTGFTLFASYPARRFSFARFGLQYGLTRTNISSFNQASTLLFESLQFSSLSGPSALNGIISSTITPSVTYNTIDNPINSTRGKSYFASVGFSGIGGNVKTITNVFDVKYFHPVRKRRNVIGVHFSAAYITGYGHTSSTCSATLVTNPPCVPQSVPNEVPPFSRLYMGGESDIRGFDIRSISPVTFIPQATAQTITYHDPTSGGALRSFTVPVLSYVATLPGGDLQGFGNFEYRIPIVGNTVTAGLFVDGGTDGVVRRSALQLNTAGFERLISPGQFPSAQNLDGLTQQLSLAPGTNFRLRASTGIEFVVQLPIIQAPFRIYYAYNVHRLHEQLVAKAPFIEPNEKASLQNAFNALDPTIYPLQIAPQLNFIQNNPGSLNYFEPKTTFRFTVSRTF